MKLAAIASSLALAFASFGASGMITSHFDTTSEGWTETIYTNLGAPTGVTSDPDPFTNLFGYPPGGITARDPSGTTAARFSAPAAFLGDQTAFLGSVFTFDLQIIENDGEKSLTVVPSILEFVNESINVAIGYTGAMPTTARTTYNIPLGPTSVGPLTLPIPPEGSWITYNASSGPAAGFIEANASHFLDVFENITRLTITGEVTDGTDDRLLLDNVGFVPIPAALPMLASGLLGLGVAAVRNRRRE